jgi:hypothetical protein
MISEYLLHLRKKKRIWVPPTWKCSPCAIIFERQKSLITNGPIVFFLHRLKQMVSWSMLHTLSFMLSIHTAQSSYVGPCDVAIIGRTLSGLMTAARLRELFPEFRICTIGTSVEDSMSSMRRPWFLVQDRKRVNYTEYMQSIRKVHSYSNIPFNERTQNIIDHILDHSATSIQKLSTYVGLDFSPVRLHTVGEGLTTNCSSLPVCKTEYDFGFLENYGVLGCRRIHRISRRSTCCASSHSKIVPSIFWQVEENPYMTLDASIFGANTDGLPTVCHTVDMLSILYRLDSFSDNIWIEGRVNYIEQKDSSWDISIRSQQSFVQSAKIVVLATDEKHQQQDYTYTTANIIGKTTENIAYETIRKLTGSWEEQTPIVADVLVYEDHSEIVEDLLQFPKATVLYSSPTYGWTLSENEAEDVNIRRMARDNSNYESAILLYHDTVSGQSLKDALFHVGIADEKEIRNIESALTESYPQKKCDSYAHRLRSNLKSQCTMGMQVTKDEC